MKRHAAVPLLSLLLPGLIVAFPILRANHTRTTYELLSTRDGVCIHRGNSDFYGFGVRLGIYFQISSTLAAIAAVPDLVHDFQTSNSILLLAIFIAMYTSSRAGDIEVVDVIILLQLMFMIMICGFSLPHIARDARAIFRPVSLIGKYTTFWGLFLRLGLGCPGVIYNLWCWFTGIDSLGGDSFSCHPYTFFFARLDALAGVRTFYKVASVLLCIFLGIPSAIVWLPELLTPGPLPLVMLFYLWALNYSGGYWSRRKVKESNWTTAKSSKGRGTTISALDWRHDLATSFKQTLFQTYRYWEYHRTSRDALQGHAFRPVDWGPPAHHKAHVHEPNPEKFFKKKWSVTCQPLHELYIKLN